MFWNYPTQVTPLPSAFPGTASNGELGVVIWQEIEKNKDDSGRIWISMQVYSRGEYTQKIRAFGPFDFVGEVPSISSVAVNKKGVICVSVLKDQDTIGVYTSSDSGDTWQEILISPNNLRAVGPRIRVNAQDEFCLFASTTTEDDFQLVWSRSEDGLLWTAPTKFTGTGNLRNPFIPYFTSNGTSDFVVFQSSMQTGNRFVYQLYFSASDDNGETWSEPVLLTKFQLPAEYAYNSYHNQNPNLIYHEGKLKLVWERTYMNSQSSQIYYTELDETGKILTEPVHISSGYSTCSWPEIFEYKGTVYVTWFDTLRDKSTTYIASYGEYGWEEKKLATTDDSTAFAVPLLCKDNFYMFWLQKNSQGVDRLMRQHRDDFAEPATFTALSYKEGVSSSAEKVRIRVNIPRDSSGIAGFSYIWTRDKTEVPPTELMRTPSNNEITEFATDDETTWFLIVRTTDFAGNWSEPTYIEYIRDVTPPLRPIIRMPNFDEIGFTVDNSPTFLWQPNPADDDVVGYSYSWNLMSDLPPGFAEGDKYTEQEVLSSPFDPPKPPLRLMTRTPRFSIRNADDGIWAFSVRAIDRLGNIGEAAVIRVFMNKYIPETIVSRIEKKQNRDGSTELIFYGKGFLRDGTVNGIFLDKDGVAPYDYIFSPERGDYEISTDKLMRGLYIDDVETGEYTVILNHTDRGLYTAPMKLLLENRGTIKYGDFTTKFLPKLKEILINFFVVIPGPYILILLLLLLFFISGIFYLRAIKKSLAEAKILNKEAAAILKGDYMSEEAKVQTQKLQLKGFSLRWKLSFFVLMLLVSVSLS
ncbi:MAG: hypothetical protein IIW10_00645, partial [Spirochaetaceae bacterium]|nr:hypothetical protein [Spirochaetaceae bacterium]